MVKGERRFQPHQLDFETLVGENARQESLTKIIKLPADSGIPEICEASTNINSVTCEVLEGKVLVEGSLQQAVVYYYDGQEIEHEVEADSFSSFIDLPGAVPGMKAYVYNRLEYVDHQLIDVGSEARFRQVTGLEILVKVTQPLEMKVATGVAGVDPDSVSIELLQLTRAVGEGSNSFTVTREIETGYSIERIVSVETSLENWKKEVYDGGVGFSAALFVTLTCLDEEGTTHTHTSSEEVKVDVSIPESKEKMQVEVLPRVTVVGKRRGEQSQQKAIVLLLVDVFARSYQYLSMDVVTNVEGMMVVKETVNGFRLVAENSVSFPLEQEHLLEGDLEKAACAGARINQVSWETGVDSLLVSGLLEKDIYYMLKAEGKDVEQRLPVEEEFNHSVTLPGISPSLNFMVNVRVESVDLEISGESINESSLLQVAVKAFSPVDLSVVVAEEVEEVPAEAAWIIYVVKSGDSVFKISRRFGVEMDAVISANKLNDPDLIYPGDKLLIPVNRK